MLDSCAQNKNKLVESNCIISKDKMDQLLKGYTPLLSSEFTEEIIVNFFNNPYLIDSTYNLALIVGNKTVIYRGNFNQNFKTAIPVSSIGKLNEIKFILSGNGKSYVFNTKEMAKMNDLDDLLQIVFVPKENDWFTFYFNFSKSDEILEGP